MKTSIKQEDTFDVLIIGSGSAALSAALKVSAHGLTCKILEKSELLGGTSAMSGAGTWIPFNHHAKKAGLADSFEDALSYIRGASPRGWQDKEDRRWTSFIKTAPEMLQFIEEKTPLKFRLTQEPDISPEKKGGKMRGRMLSPQPLSKWTLGKYAGKIRSSTLPHLYTYQEVYDGDLYHRPIWATFRIFPKIVWRLLTRTRAQGSALITGLLRGCLNNGCQIETNSRVLGLIKDDATSRVIGAVVDVNGRRKYFGAKSAVVIASGGFEWNPEMLLQHFPGELDWLGSPRTNEGDGQRIAAEAGAALDNMDQANVYPAIPTRYEKKLHGLPSIFQAEPNAIVVNRHGKRFVNEYDFNIGLEVDRRDPATGDPVNLPGWVITDSRILHKALPLAWYSRYSPDWIVRAQTIEELASKINVPASTLKATVSRFNEFCNDGKDLDFKRGESAWDTFKAGGDGALESINKPPYLAMPFNRTILGTKGGARTNEFGQVLTQDNVVIPGLYAAGLAMSNPIGTVAIGPGTTIGPNLTWGYICAKSILAESSK